MEAESASAQGVEDVPNISAARSYSLTYSRASDVRNLWAASFNHVHPALEDYFAVAGGRLVEIYLCRRKEIRKIVSFESENETEDFFAVCWLYDTVAKCNMLAFAGAGRAIRIVNFDAHGPEFDNANLSHSKDLYGHFDEVNDLRVHPYHFDVFASAGKDHSVRIWNARCNNCLVVLSGLEGHNARVLSVDWHMSGTKLVSGSHDRHVKIWKLAPEMIQEFTKGKDDPFTRTRPFFHGVVEFTTNRIHPECVDEVLFIGDYVLSKGPSIYPALWEPDNYKIGTTSVYQRYESSPAPGSYWHKVGYDITKSIVAFGDCTGALWVYHVDSGKKIPAKPSRKVQDPYKATTVNASGR
eukprot:TRINITY_DN10235_c0_g1_i1.p1 TRINITY_DN10235_c0_g1~~TRINITY_DN10235_c0_g1_i1.p1  ORF type:complete len:354 (+),score=64.46 TRINITY_DN10235_c0_g1_i1:52-1113(+)